MIPLAALVDTSADYRRKSQREWKNRLAKIAEEIAMLLDELPDLHPDDTDAFVEIMAEAGTWVETAREEADRGRFGWPDEELVKLVVEKRPGKLGQMAYQKFERYWTAAGWHVVPIATRETVEDEAAAQAMLPFVTRDGSGFAKLADDTGLPLSRVLGGGKWLVSRGFAMPVVTRGGGFGGVYVPNRPVKALKKRCVT